jgi:hypothetical protein
VVRCCMMRPAVLRQTHLGCLMTKACQIDHPRPVALLAECGTKSEAADDLRERSTQRRVWNGGRVRWSDACTYPDTVGRLYAVEKEAEQIIELLDAFGGRGCLRQPVVCLNSLYSTWRRAHR